LPEELLKVIEHRARQEKVDESTAIRQLLALGAEEYAAELAGVTLRQMVDLLQRHGVKGNVRPDQQRKALEFVGELAKHQAGNTGLS
jgi:hypothetical protein